MDQGWGRYGNSARQDPGFEFPEAYTYSTSRNEPPSVEAPEAWPDVAPWEGRYIFHHRLFYCRVGENQELRYYSGYVILYRTRAILIPLPGTPPFRGPRYLHPAYLQQEMPHSHSISEPQSIPVYVTEEALYMIERPYEYFYRFAGASSIPLQEIQRTAGLSRFPEGAPLEVGMTSPCPTHLAGPSSASGARPSMGITPHNQAADPGLPSSAPLSTSSEANVNAGPKSPSAATAGASSEAAVGITSPCHTQMPVAPPVAGPSSPSIAPLGSATTSLDRSEPDGSSLPLTHETACSSSRKTKARGKGNKDELGKLCQKERDLCAHKCHSPCHPGECPPCKALERRACYCGGLVHCFECDKFTSASDTELANMLSCGQLCQRKLPNCRHLCSDICHPGPCRTTHNCSKKVMVGCACQRLKKEWVCSDVQNAPLSKVQKAQLLGLQHGRISGLVPCDEECLRLTAIKETQTQAEVLHQRKEKGQEVAAPAHSSRRRSSQKRHPRIHPSKDLSPAFRYWSFILGVIALILVVEGLFRLYHRMK